MNQVLQKKVVSPHDQSVQQVETKGRTENTNPTSGQSISGNRTRYQALLSRLKKYLQVNNDNFYYALTPFRYNESISTEGVTQAHRILRFDILPFRTEGESKQPDKHNSSRIDKHFNINHGSDKIALNTELHSSISKYSFKDPTNRNFRLFGVPFERHLVYPPKEGIKAFYLSKIPVNDPESPLESPVQLVIYETVDHVRYAAGVKHWNSEMPQGGISQKPND